MGHQALQRHLAELPIFRQVPDSAYLIADRADRQHKGHIARVTHSSAGTI